MRLLLLVTLLLFLQPGFSIRKGEPPKVNRNVENNFRVPVGSEYVIFTCPILSNAKTDGVIVSWLKDDEEISEEWPKYKLANNNRDLKIKDPQQSDEGVFTCNAVNGFGHVDVQFFLEVYDPNNDIHLGSHESISYATKPSAPVWNSKKTNDGPIYLSAGDRLELLCPAIGNPLPKITWYKNGHILDMGEIRHHKSAKLQLDDVTRNDSGTYTCRLENRHGSVTGTFNVFVGGASSAMKKLKSSFESGDQNGEAWGGNNKNVPIIDEPQNSTVVRGQPAEFRCHMAHLSNIVNPVFRWLKETKFPGAATALTIRNKTFTILDQPTENTKITSGAKRTKIYTNTLRIPHVTENDSGQYICVITSADGYIGYRAAQLNVISPNLDGSPLNVFFPTGIVILGIIFILFVALAVAWLRCTSSGTEKNSTQSKSICSTGSDCYPTSFNSTAVTKKTLLSSGLQPPAPPPPPPRIPAPETPNGMFMQKNYLISLHGTPTGSPLLQHERRLRPPNSATLDRRYRPQPQQILHRTFAEDEMSRLSSNIYDSGSPLPPPPSQTTSSHIYCTTSPQQSRRKRPGECGIDDNFPSMNYRNHHPFANASPRW